MKFCLLIWCSAQSASCCIRIFSCLGMQLLTFFSRMGRRLDGTVVVVYGHPARALPGLQLLRAPDQSRRGRFQLFLILRLISTHFPKRTTITLLKSKTRSSSSCFLGEFSRPSQSQQCSD